MSVDNFEVRSFKTAESFWDALSPTNQLLEGPHRFVFRGQANSKWGLVPSLLRPYQRTCEEPTDQANLKHMYFLEHRLLEVFMKSLDRVGLVVPNDSEDFRKLIVDPSAAIDGFKRRKSIPERSLLNLMAKAQHHGVPTRLLDWTTQSYTACYFAASSALACHKNWDVSDHFAVWALDTEMSGLYDDLILHTSPGSTSPHLAAQAGLFTVHPNCLFPKEGSSPQGLEHLFVKQKSPLIKLVLPVFEAPKLLEYCEKAGFSAANIYPSADGAGKSALDCINIEDAISKWNTETIMIR